jgi:putative DNA primase/helicase
MSDDKPPTEPFSLDDEEYERLEQERNQIIDNANEKYGGGNDRPNGASSDDKRSVAEKLIDLISQNSNSFFKDQYDVPFARIHNTDHHEIVRVGSDKFKRYLGRLYYENENKVANTEALTNAVQVLQAKSEYRGDTIPLSLRVASHNGDIFYDLTNEKWQCVRITREYWQLLDEAPSTMFMRYNQTSQVQPDCSYEPDIFERFLELTNLKKEEDRILLKVYVISLFIPNIQHVILQVHGEKGSQIHARNSDKRACGSC